MSTVIVLSDIQKRLDPEFEQLFREHYALIYRTAYSVTGRSEDAEDVAQAIFLRLLRREIPPDLHKNPKGYLYRAAFNGALSVLRARRRRMVTENIEEVHEAAPPLRGIDDDLRRTLHDAIAELHPRSAQILILRYVHDCDLTEIAKIVGTTRSTVAVSLFRARARLKKLIRASMEGMEEK
jgi:RNA polymerase sigma-70 factor (ECF subfamily)